jgi:hypothetical protein
VDDSVLVLRAALEYKYRGSSIESPSVCRYYVEMLLQGRSGLVCLEEGMEGLGWIGSGRC